MLHPEQRQKPAQPHHELCNSLVSSLTKRERRRTASVPRKRYGSGCRHSGVCTVNKETLTPEVTDTDETTERKNVKDVTHKESPSSSTPPHMRSNSARVFSRHVKTSDETSAQVMMRWSGLQWRVGTMGLTRHLSQASQVYQTAKHHVRKGPNHDFEGCADWVEQRRRLP